MTFCYKTSSDLELLEHIRNSSSAAISVAKKYHTVNNNFDTVLRINKARKILKLERMAAYMTTMTQEVASTQIVEVSLG